MSNAIIINRLNEVARKLEGVDNILTDIQSIIEDIQATAEQDKASWEAMEQIETIVATWRNAQ